MERIRGGEAALHGIGNCGRRTGLSRIFSHLMAGESFARCASGSMGINKHPGLGSLANGSWRKYRVLRLCGLVETARCIEFARRCYHLNGVLESLSAVRSRRACADKPTRWLPRYSCHVPLFWDSQAHHQQSWCCSPYPPLVSMLQITSLKTT
jgi:hypothetical protein